MISDLLNSCVDGCTSAAAVIAMQGLYELCVSQVLTLLLVCVRLLFGKKMRLQANELFVYKFQKYNIPYNYFAFWKRTNASKFVLCIIMISTYLV